MENKVTVDAQYMGAHIGTSQKSGKDYTRHTFNGLGLVLELFDIPNGIKPEAGKKYRFEGSLGNGNRGGVSFNAHTCKLIG